jgi:molybdate/tungstate transport system ATP-binding protein
MSVTLTGVRVAAGGFNLGPLDLAIRQGEYVALMGRTGQGKSTLLEAIAGLRTVTAGRIRIGDRDVTELAPGERRVGYVPQDLALFPTLRVRENLAFALNIRGLPWQARVSEIADWLGIGHLLERKVTTLSGGEAQRCALGRALASEPELLLLDEPFSALDEETCEQMYELMLRIREKVSVLHVTHHRAEAVRLGDRVLRLRRSPDGMDILEVEHRSSWAGRLPD